MEFQAKILLTANRSEKWGKNIQTAGYNALCMVVDALSDG
jgi:hypothetical protein